MEEEEQEQVYNFEGSDGQKYSAKKSELPELVEQAKAAGVVLKGVMSKEESTAARDDDYWTWDNAKAGVRGIWEDPTGEHGALAYMGLNVASGLGTAAGKVIGGMIKGVADVGFGLARGVARGVESLVGADGHAVSGFLGDWHDSFNEITDALTPDIFEKRGMYDGIEGAHETMGAINSFAESVFAMKGMGLAAKGVGALAGGRKAAAIGQAVVAAGMGGKGYAEMAEDPEGPGGWRQELAAAAKGGIEAAMFGVLGPWKKMNMAMPKPFEQLTKTEIVKRFTIEALKSGAMMGGVAAAKEGVEALATAGTDQNWHKKSAWEVSKTVMSEFLVGSAFHAVNALGKSGAWLAWRADRKNGEGAITFQVEQNRKTYAPIMNRQAELALRAREVGAGWLEAGMEGTENVKRVLPSGAVQFDDGSVWQMGRDGRARITVADGTILDARTGAVEGYRANREADVQRDAEGNEVPKRETQAENTAIMLDALERGELPTVAERLEGLQITETSYKKGTVLDGEWDQAKAPPVIVWVGNDGTRVLVTGRSRAAAAAAAGVKEIKAVEVREDQGWSRQQAESLDAVENMREGRGTREEIARGVEALGIRSEEDCDRYGIVPERPVLDAITVLNEGSEALKSAATEGTVGRAWAAECAEKLGKKSLGEASERAQATALDMIAGKLPPEEAGAAMDAIAELAARKPDYTDREAADAIRAARERAVGHVAVDADSEMVEMPDGSIKSVAEAKAEGAAEAQEAAAEGKTVDESGWLPKAPAAQGADKAAEPMVKADGSVGCVRFEGAKATRTRSEDGREIVLIEGMAGEEMMRPENRDAAVQFVTRLKEMAGDVDLVFADVSAADAAEALLMAKRVQARAEDARSSVSGDSIAGSNQLVDAGQRLVDGLFGEKSGIRVRTGTREEAEAALRAAGETKPIKDAEGQVQGYYHRGKGEVVLFEGADAGTLAHEIGWHAVWHWAERNSPDLLLKMKRYAARTPLELKAQIKEVYGDFKGDALMDEIGAGRFERAMGERFQKLLAKSPEVRGWWRKVLHALARAWKGMARTVGGNRVDLKKIEKMDPEEAIEALTAQMLEGRRLGEGRGNAEGDIRPSIKWREQRAQQESESFKNFFGDWENDPKNASKVVDKKGRPLVLFHETGGDFTVFNPRQGGAGDHDFQTPFGIFMKPNRDEIGVAKDGQRRQMELYANIRNPMRFNNRDELDAHLRASCEGYARGADAIKEMDREYKEKLESAKGLAETAWEKLYGKYGGEEEYKKIQEEHEKYTEEAVRIQEEWGKKYDRMSAELKEEVDRYFRDSGHDGIILEYDGGSYERETKAYIAFSPEQVKSATDNIGTFDPGNPDIRFSRRKMSELAEGDIRPSIGGIYTGTAADYANRSRQGGKDDGPSLKKIGSGEGSQVYGWGLYGSNVRSVADRYANEGRDTKEFFAWDVSQHGKKIDLSGGNSAEVMAAREIARTKGDVRRAVRESADLVKRLKEGVSAGVIPGDTLKKQEAVLKKLKEGGWESRPGEARANLYEQTFFTDRAPGDESHLLKWYEPISEEQLGWIRAQAEKEGIPVYEYGNGKTGRNILGKSIGLKVDGTGRNIYEAVKEGFEWENGEDAPRLASEFLARAGIDGVKYPVDSYGGKGVKDGDVAGWNYVSFRDDNIRVDHKWTDGEMRYSRAMVGTDKGVFTTKIDTKNPKTKDGKNTVILRRSPKETTAAVEGTSSLKAVEGALPAGVKVGDKGTRYTPEEKARVKKFVKDVAKAQRGKVENPEFGEIMIGRDFVMEVQTHAISTAREIAAVSSAREIAANMKHFAASPNEEVKPGRNRFMEYGLAKFEFEGDTYLVMGEVGIRKDSTPYYDQRVVAKLKAEPTPLILHDGMEADSAFDAVYDNRFRILLQACKEWEIKESQQGGGAQKDSQQFKRWFADSKVVDENGEPLVVYRGSPYDPLAQEEGKGVIKPEAYFTADPEYAKRYTGNGGKVGAYYLNIRRPFDIRDPECLKDLQSIYPDHEFIKGKSGALDWGEASIVDGEFLRENFGDKYDGIVYDEGGDPTGSEVKYRGVSYVPLDGGAQVKSATDNIGTFDPGNPDIRFARGGKRRDEVYDDVLRAVRAGGQRVAAGRSERTEAGFDAGAALWMEREGQMGKSQDGSMTLSYSEALRLYRAMSASAHMPKVLERMPHLATRDRKGRLRLNAAAFGIVDKSDLEAVKAGLKEDGMFLHEDPSWRLHNDFEEVRAMKEMSEQALAEEMEKLAEARITGKMSGGGRTAVNILAKEIGRIACELPVTAGAPQSLKDLRKLGLGIAKELGDPKGELGKEAREAARWWREQDPVRKDPTATKSEDIAESELWAEMFGMFLADPMALEERAPNVYGKMVEAIAGNEKLSEAWNGLRRTRDAEGPHERVMRDIERQWSVNEQQAYKELLAELDKPIGKWGKRTRARLLLELHSAEGPAVMWVTDAVRERLAELKRLKKAGKIGEEEYDQLAGGAKRELEKMRVALLHKQRGGGTGRLYALDFASGVMEDVARDGVDMGDLRRYMYAKSVRDGLHQKGKAAALGMDQREAQKVLEELEGRLGADGWAKLETAAKRFQATREQHLLENEFVLEAFGKDLVNYWKMNASYVRSERTWTAEEVAAYEAARSDWMARHPGESTVIAEIEALMDMHVAKGSGTAGSSFLKPLAGSLKAVKDPIAATLENDLRIIEFAQRNHWACQLAESAKTLGMEGFAVMEDRGGGGKLRGSNRYGSVTFLKDGKRMTLVMPKVVAEGFEHDSRGVNKLVKLNRWASAILTQYSPRFALRNIWRNRASNANNIAWMGEGRLVTGMGMVGMRPVARLATFLLERAASHLPDRFARNALMNVLYGSKTNLYWEAEATRLAKMMQDPQLLRRRAEEANSLMLQGKSAEAQRLWDDIQKCQEFMKLPIFAGVRKQIMGESGKADLDELMRSLNLETNFDGTKLTGLKRAKRWMVKRAETVKRFNDFEEARVKLIALLAAQHEAELAQARGEAAPRSRDEITYQVATMSGSPRYENRGRAMNYIEFACGPFMNVGMKGAWRTVESMRYDPKSWWTKAAGRIAGRLATYVLWMGGGYKVVADWLRGDAGDDEEKKKRVDAFERFGKRMAHALANVSDYRLRNYDIVPVGLYGKWSTLAISMPRGDEDRLLMPTVDLLANGMLGSEKAQEMGFALPTDLNYGKTEAAQNTFFGSGLLPDSFRRGILWTVAQDLLGPVFGINPYNSFTQRTVYSKADFDARWEEPWNMAKKVGKQVWNDVGGQVVMPATTWDEDEGAYDDQGQWALSGAEEGEAGCMPIGGKTIFQALHSIPFLSAAASGLITFQNGGNERIARRLEKYRRDDSAPLRAAAQRVADEVIEARRKYGEDFDYSEMLEARVSELELPEEDKEIIQGLAFNKCQRIIKKMGMEFDPIGKALEKMSNDEKKYRRAKRQVEAEGWDGDFD